MITERMKRVLQLHEKRQLALAKLVEPAKAAMHQMQDAGMKNGAAPLVAILTED